MATEKKIFAQVESPPKFHRRAAGGNQEIPFDYNPHPLHLTFIPHVHRRPLVATARHKWSTDGRRAAYCEHDFAGLVSTPTLAFVLTSRPSDNDSVKLRRFVRTLW